MTRILTDLQQDVISRASLSEQAAELCRKMERANHPCTALARQLADEAEAAEQGALSVLETTAQAYKAARK